MLSDTQYHVIDIGRVSKQNKKFGVRNGGI